MLINQMYWRNVWCTCVNDIKHSPLHQSHSREEEQAFSRRMSKLRHSRVPALRVVRIGPELKS